MEEAMIQSRMLLIVEVLFGCTLLAGSLVALRIKQAVVESIVPKVRVEESVRIYQHRMQATSGLLAQDRLDIDGL
jgi:hypothetical protein